ncbi:MAG: TolC family protein, partial [Sinobacteraceae bacterium]|nr:TolC family protein [Nevskiaceae bacterium]
MKRMLWYLSGRQWRAQAVVLSAVLLGACTVGPDFHPPAVQAGAGYAKAAMPAASASTANSKTALEYGGKIAADWYSLLQAPALNGLVQQALKHNPGLKAARARIAQAQARLRAANGGRWPQLQGRALANRAHFNPQALGFPAAGAGNNNAFAGILQLS